MERFKEMEGKRGAPIFLVKFRSWLHRIKRNAK